MINLLKTAQELFTEDTKKRNSSFIVDSIIGTILLAIKKYNESEANILIYAANNYDANQIYNKLSSLIDEDKIILLPGDDLIRVEYISESKEIRSELIYGLYKIRHAHHSIIIATPSTIYRYYPGVETFDNSFIDIHVGDDIDVNQLKNKLSELGYISVSKIDQSMEYASRGGVLDVFSLNYEDPIRIEFFDTVVESIRLFKIETQTSYKKLDNALLIPATINLLSQEEKEKVKNKITYQLNKDLLNKNEQEKEELEVNVQDDIDQILNNSFTNKYYKYLSFLQEKFTELLDFCDNYSIIVANQEDFNKAKGLLFEEATKFLLDLHAKNKNISHLSYFNERASIFKGALETTILEPFYHNKDDVSIPLRSLAYLDPKGSTTLIILETLIKGRNQILIVYHSEEEGKEIRKILDSLEVTYSETENYSLDENTTISICQGKFNVSFELTNKNIILLASDDLLYDKRKIRAYSTHFKKGKILESYEELEPGDYVVHEKYGIGRFVKIDTIEVMGKHNDYLEISYANNDKLFVPLYQFNLIRKFVGKEGATPRLTNLNSNQWEKTKKRIKERVNDLADRLLTLYQERATIAGFSFKKDDEIQKAFEEDFKHQLTPDQQTSIKEIKEDMEAPHPMDRLLCGDVGFGKTEVALEACMKAILSEKQVCFLCPTTVLSMQHYKVALKRFGDFRINVKLLNRMCTSKEVNETLKGLKDGSVNLLIGTHKALNDKVVFKDLGLLIIDEEQRFGVEQKERIKEKYPNVDVLTLSATPIPRTLQSSLIGLKAISRIETAPVERLPIQTYVINYDEEIIKELIKRELSRNGQVYYIFNDTYRIYEKQLLLQKLVPDAKIGIIHGKMDKEDVDIVMNDFYEGTIDVLLATTIVENGIDVRNANLLLVEDADHFGLSQLYQIKGRVGRSDKIAYAYLMIKGNKSLTEESKKRLKAIQDFTELGSGYKIAQRDLLIRGAGDILGKEQAGFIDEVGIDMYIRLLNETIAEKQGKLDKSPTKDIKALQDLDAYVPKGFAKNDEKIEIYQKILDCKTLDKLYLLKDTLKDQFGALPQSVELLLLKREISIYLEGEEYETYTEYPKRIDIVLSKKFSDIKGIGTTLFTSFLKFINKLKLSYHDKSIFISINKERDRIPTLIDVLKNVSKIYKNKMGAMIKDENWQVFKTYKIN